MEAKKIVIKQLFDRRFSAGDIFYQLKFFGINTLFIYRTINQFLDTNSCKNRIWPGRRRSAHTEDCTKRICE